MLTDEQKLISIIIPVYNVEDYIDRCLESVLNQSYKNLEIILVDDGSKDSSGKICDEYAKKDERIKVIHKENGGLSDARNAGLAVATGDYIGYVDSDDWVETDMYENMLRACLENDADVAICRYFEEYKDETISGGNGKQYVFDRENLIKAYIEDNDEIIIYNSVWSKLYKREIVDKVLFPVGRNSEDIMYTTKAFCKAKKGVYIDTCYYHYVLDRAGSIMNEKRADRMFNDEIPFWIEHSEYIRKAVSDDLGNLAEYYYYRRLLSYYVDLSKTMGGKDTAKRIAEILVFEKERIKYIYSKCKLSKGDRFRMNLFLFSPWAYNGINNLYLKIRKCMG